MRVAALLAMACILLSGGAASADVPKDERNLEREIRRLNDAAAKPDGEKAVIKRLTAEYKTTDAQVQTLRRRTLGYGEIAVVLSLAQALPDGATDANVQKVLGLRQGPPVAGWGQVAKQLNTKLGRTVSQVRRTANNTNREIKDDHARAGKAPKVGTQEQPEKKAPEAPRPFTGEGKSMDRGGSAR